MGKGLCPQKQPSINNKLTTLEMWGTILRWVPHFYHSTLPGILIDFQNLRSAEQESVLRKDPMVIYMTLNKTWESLLYTVSKRTPAGLGPTVHSSNLPMNAPTIGCCPFVLFSVYQSHTSIFRIPSQINNLLHILILESISEETQPMMVTKHFTKK